MGTRVCVKCGEHPAAVCRTCVRMKRATLLADASNACNILQHAPEIELKYTHEDVMRLDTAASEAYQVLLAAIKKANME